jgi:hypothetical protein
MDRNLLRRRRAIERARADPSWGDAASVSTMVRNSWARCAPILDTQRDGAPVGAEDEAREHWAASPIRHAAPDLAGHLEDVAQSSDLIAAVTDAAGRVLWQWTPSWLRPGADRIGLMRGGVWNEGAAGTNGIGLALAADKPAVVFATEHWVTPVRDWVCYSAPVHDADGAQVGVLDLSTMWQRANPLGLATITSMARVVEHQLRSRRGMAPRRSDLHLTLLGRPRAELAGVEVPLSLRQLEILAILAIVEATTLDLLHALLYGDRAVAMTTLKAEVSHLRRALGGGIASRPYRLTVPCDVDALMLLARLDSGDADGAARLYRGQLLPASEAPLVVERRLHLDVALRTALLRRGSTAALLRYADVHPHDTEVIERAVAVAASDDPLLPTATARLAVAMADLPA